MHWEQKFCQTNGVRWGKLIETKKYVDLYSNITSWDDSAGKEAFENANVELVTLTDYEHVVEESLETGYISDADVQLLHEWRKDPANWKK